MNNLILREWNNQKIRQREDNYICLTDMCKACEKQFAKWYRLDSTKEYLEELSKATGIPVSTENPDIQIRTSAENPLSQGIQALVEIYKGGTPELQGTWGHRKVALRLAQWLSPKFAIQVDTWIEELLTTGNVNLKETQKLPQTYLEALKELVASEEKRQLAEKNAKQTQGKLNEAEDVLDTYRAILSPESCLTVAEVAKALGVKNLGRNNLFSYLRRKDFIQQKPSVEPYQNRIDQELAVVDLLTINKGSKQDTTPQTKLTFKGLEWLIKKLIADNYPVNTTAKVVWDHYNGQQSQQHQQT